jgi:hypothetical protein
MERCAKPMVSLENWTSPGTMTLMWHMCHNPTASNKNMEPKMNTSNTVYNILYYTILNEAIVSGGRRLLAIWRMGWVVAEHCFSNHFSGYVWFGRKATWIGKSLQITDPTKIPWIYITYCSILEQHLCLYAKLAFETYSMYKWFSNVLGFSLCHKFRREMLPNRGGYGSKTLNPSVPWFYPQKVCSSKQPHQFGVVRLEISRTKYGCRSS